MRRILIAECEQEISSFNPVPSEYDLFDVHVGDALARAHAGAQTCVRGAMDVFSGCGEVEPIAAYGAKACSAGPLSRAGYERISGELLGAVERHADDADAVYLCLHGAMGADGEPDPEGQILEAVRRRLGPTVPIVISLDLHGIPTPRMLTNCDAVVVYRTYPHEDFVDTGARAARLLLRLLDEPLRPTIARVRIPALVRGPELITATGVYGEILDEAAALERDGEALAAAVTIGNPFTDAPELGCHALVVTDGDAGAAGAHAVALAERFWSQRERMQATLVDLDEAIADAMTRRGPVTFTDAADAPSSGASGDGNAILGGLLRHGYPGRVLMPVVDARAAQAAHEAGVGARLVVAIGGSLDPRRFPPIELEVEVAALGNGRYRHQVSHMWADAGRTAVLEAGNVCLVVVSRVVHMMDRSIFLAHGRDPEEYDLVVVKSPGAYARYFTFAERNYVVDVPGATTANLPRLGHSRVRRPIFPLDADVTFEPRAEIFGPSREVP